MRTFPFDDNRDLELDPNWAELLTQPACPVHVPGGGDAWLVTRYDDVRTILTDPRFSRSEIPDEMLTAILGPSAQRFRAALVMMAPAKHNRLRKLAAKAFSARRVAELRPMTQEIATRLFDEMIEKGPPADLVADLAQPLTLGVICELLGVPYEDMAFFESWAEAAHATTAFTPEQVREANKRILDYLGELVARRYAEPKADLLSALALARDDDDRLTEAEVVNLAVSLLLAGHETTSGEIGDIASVLLTHEEHMRWARKNRDRLSDLVEEMLRWVPLSTLLTPFGVTEDLDLGGARMKAGDTVLPSRTAANRDPRYYPNPDDLDFDRAQPAPHLAFSHGAHHCIGASLARMELGVAIGTLLDRLPGMKLAVPAEELPWKPGKVIRSLQRLPVTW